MVDFAMHFSKAMISSNMLLDNSRHEKYYLEIILYHICSEYLKTLDSLPNNVYVVKHSVWLWGIKYTLAIVSNWSWSFNLMYCWPELYYANWYYSQNC